jgi:hypothetical protein
LNYTSRFKAALSIASADKNTSTVRVYTGLEPPQQFDEDGDQLAGISFVQVDAKIVWERPITF